MSRAILHDAIHVARKARRCDQCLQMIVPGQRYRKQVHTYDGVGIYAAHADCDELSAVLTGTGDEPYMLHDGIDENDRGRVAKDFPVVAERLGIRAWSATETY